MGSQAIDLSDLGGQPAPQQSSGIDLSDLGGRPAQPQGSAIGRFVNKAAGSLGIPLQDIEQHPEKYEPWRKEYWQAAKNVPTADYSNTTASDLAGGQYVRPFAEGDIAGGLGQLVGPAVAVAGMVGGGKSAAAAEGASEAASAAESRIAGPIKATMQNEVPEIVNHPDKAVAGADQLLQASSPTKTQTNARANFQVAAGDLAKVYDEVNWGAAKGGKALLKRNAPPDMRLRAARDAVNQRMSDMYNEEIAPKMQGLEGVPAQVTPNAEGYNYLAQTAGDPTVRNLAAKVSADPNSLTIPEAYQLAKGVNAELISFEAQEGPQQHLLRNQNPGINQLEVMDQQLNQTINQGMKDRGLPGIDRFNRRYAAMADVRKGFNGRINEVEMRRAGLAGRVIGTAIKTVRGGPVHAIPSGSAAANADIPVGDYVQQGLQRIRDSGIQPVKDPEPPAPDLTLQSPGQMPPAQQRPLPFMNSPNPSRAGTVYPQGAGAGGPSFAGEGQPSTINVPAKSSAPKSPPKASGNGGFKMPSAADDLALAVRQAQKAGTRKDYFVNQLTRYMYPSNAAKVTPAMAAKAWDEALQK